MATKNVKALYLDSDGVYKSTSDSDTLNVGDIKLGNQKVNNGVLSTDSNGAVTSALIKDANVSSNAADRIAGSKVTPDFTGQVVSGTGSGLTGLNASNLASGTIPDARFPATLPALNGSNLTNLDADDLATGTVPAGRISGAYSGITGVGVLTTGTWQAGAIADSYLGTISSANKVSNSATTATADNTGGAIVARDISGNFSAGTVTADLVGDVTGNASSADKWSSSRNVAFSGGDVSGNFDIDGSANVTAVNLTIGDGVVETAMIATGAVTTDKINDAAVTNAKLATASSANTASAVVLRDASGNFAAGMITANLTGDVTGNASTSSKWAASRQVSFAGGDVTGSFDIDGSANVSNVALTIGADKVVTSMIANSAVTADKLAGSIPDTKLSTISTAGKVADTALSSNVAKYDAATPVFTGKLGVGAVTAADVAKAATVQFVLDQVAAAEAGLDYKQEAQWYFSDLPMQVVLADFVELVNTGWGNPFNIGPINGKFTAGDRILFISYNPVETGIYVFSGSDGSWVLNRSTDMAPGSDAAGAYLFCQDQILISEGQGQPGQPPPLVLSYPSLDASYVCNNAKGDAVVGTDALTFIQYGIAPVYTGTAPIAVNGTAISISVGSGLSTAGGTLAAKPDGSTLEINNSGDIAFKSLPSEFKINALPTSVNVTADNLNTLTAGKTTIASALHRHPAPISVLSNSGGWGVGVAVYFDGTDLQKADRQYGKVIGMIASSSGSDALVATGGEAQILTPSVQTGTLEAGDNVYLGQSGGFTNYASLGSGDYVTKVGKYLGVIGGQPKVAVAIQEFGIKP